jgi:TonB family protein
MQLEPTTLTRNRVILRPWLGACCAAVALHAGIAAMLLMQSGGAASEETLGAMAIEIGVESAAPSFDAAEVAEVPDASSTTAAVALAGVTTTHEEKASELSTQIAEAGDQPVATKTMTDRDERVETEVQASSPAAAASPGGGAPSRVAERDGLQSIATSIGNSAEAKRARAAWQRGLLAHIERQKRAPAGAERSTDVIVNFSIDRQGRLVAVEIVKGSGDARYDRAALDMVHRADPMPPPPPDQEKLSFRIPISFRTGG